MSHIDAKLTAEQRRAVLARLDEAQEERERKSSLPTCVHCWDGSHRTASPECYAPRP